MNSWGLSVTKSERLSVTLMNLLETENLRIIVLVPEDQWSRKKLDL